MYPTLFTIPFLPEGWGEIKSYGAMLTIGFLSAIWLAARRAMRSQANPDIVLNIGLISLVAGVVGARVFFVWHYWDSRFATEPSPIWAALRIDRGGLEFWGGPLLAIPAVAAYLWWTKSSIRWYLDIVAPSLMWGLAFGRIGCLLNGCCWGGVCLDPHDPDRQKPGVPWAIRFPYSSPAMTQQYWFRQMTLPRELIYVMPSGESIPFPREILNMSRAERDGPQREYERAEAMLAALRKGGADDALLRKQQAEVQSAKARLERHDSLLRPLVELERRSGLSQSELSELASHYRSLPVHPTQIYSMINAFLLAWLLSVMFYRRERHGIVFGWMLALKGASRFVLEAIRQDNPLDVANLTVSQSVCLGILAFCVVYFIIIYRLPLKSPAAQPFVFEEDQAPVATARPAM